MRDESFEFDGYAVSAGIDGGELRVVNDMEYALDLGEGESYARQGYVDCMTGEISFNAEIVDVDDYALRALFDLDFVRDMTNALLSYRVDTCGKRRKTTYKTIRRDCAKRNRHK